MPVLRDPAPLNMARHVPWWHRGLVRKAVTRPRWWWQQRRPWPVRRRVFRLPAHVVATESGTTRLVVQAAPHSLDDAAWAAYSFLRQLDRPGERLGLTLYLDTADPATLARAAAQWQRLFPGAEVLDTHEPGERLAGRAPAVAAFARVHPTGRKLAVVLAAQERASILFVDPDVLLFRFPAELAESMRRGGPPRYNLEDGELNGDARLVAHARREGWPAPAGLNSGLLFIPRGALAVADAERLLAGGEFDPGSWFVEQTALALLLTAAGAEPLPGARYVVSTQGQFYGDPDRDYGQIVTRHFTTPVRHLMYARGMPLLWRQWREKSP